jgi:uncharacterized Zn finger protein
MGWGYDNYYPPYVPVAERRANAAKEVAKRLKSGAKIFPVKIEGLKITKSFWGNSWCGNLEAYSDYANRLPRGRTYVRNGSVVHLHIEKGQITAMVSGSEVYDVKITISPLEAKTWSGLKAESAGQIGSLVELLQGKLSKQVMEIVTRRDTGLFPKPREIKMRCSCPDSAGMCKHLAAVMYGVGARLDQQPELLFTLRHVDHLELIQGAGQADIVGKPSKTGKKTIASGDLADMFGIEMAGPVDPVSNPANTAQPEALKPKKRASQPKPSQSTAVEPKRKTSNAVKPIDVEPALVASSKPRAKPGSKLAGSTEPVATKVPAKRRTTSKTKVTVGTISEVEPNAISKGAKSESKSGKGKSLPRKKPTAAPSVKSLARTKTSAAEKAVE